MKFEELPKPIPIGKSEDLRGQKFGELTVLFKVLNPNDQRKSYWACLCNCGEYCIKRTDKFKGKNPCCDIYKHYISIGQKFKRLTVVKREEEFKKTKGWKYICYCDCGNPTPIITWGNYLTAGTKGSCGCLRDNCRNDITGKRFGMLTALEPTNKLLDRSVVWKCQCDCGNIFYTSCARLIRGNNLSCGEHTFSSGEIEIAYLLNNNNIEFNHDKPLNDCYFPDTKKCARFDFYLLNNNQILEYDGIQHFKCVEKIWNTKENFITMHNHDLYKNQWAWDNNLSMKRIPYNYKGELTFERIISDEFLITPQTHPWWYPPKDSSYPYFTLEDIDKLKDVS